MKKRTVTKQKGFEDFALELGLSIDTFMEYAQAVRLAVSEEKGEQLMSLAEGMSKSLEGAILEHKKLSAKVSGKINPQLKLPTINRVEKALLESG